ncbi:cell division protein FtsQ/DivIB [Colwellia sp. 4_MG-2023]|jgi:cell division protein FtsQ|uniref:cell division protein FtsQ/DivIB n=1 Tax=unclassified Colwellia TaxID=196834 RepID=UPI001C08C5C2|nr:MULTISPECIES: cell division protein FtsQ/DivIB [unclassified Colwellia]MBU2926210.1 cell division protein FtsQ/DivIB [Colwellia sp. C2M11]MDO6507180.1 cell division protein FtsQ/DivIB [Colwellia sp. 5_MG-2023]MDO6556016.1 cell division protein FtsQ/DivIB [Colwellia sp. 4_MG-2023]MDO6652369.1 cell division protein FtsQ/DivIB [Colwellia sp. 3_MG-2023]MDO6665756.1 cell division protein FtsQ/DivIB [Colwellia sp. 2_MG-2023]
MNDKQLTPENQKTIAFGVGLAFFVCVLIGLFSLGWWLSEVFIERERSPVNSIVIMGEMPYTQRTEVLESMSNIDLGNFFQVDVNEIQSQVSKLPWVYSVAVRKQWPNEVRIYVVDQTPIALWNGDFILNKFGKAFQAEQKAIKQTLPQFFGPEGSELLALQNFNNLNDLLEYRDLAIDELILGERFSWQLTLNNGIRLNLGREERVKRVQRFMDVYPLINEHLLEQNKSKKELKQAVDYIDLRYDTGLAVGWKEKDDLSSSISVEKQQRKSRIGMLKKHVLQESMVPIYKFRDDLFSRNKLHTEELTLNV